MSTSSIQPDDPKLTAYALGALDESDRADFEARLEHDPAARRAVDDIRAAATILTQELAVEPSPGLSDGQRRTVLRRAHNSRRPGAYLPTAMVWRIAAGLVVCAGLAWFLFGGNGIAKRAEESDRMVDLARLSENAPDASPLSGVKAGLETPEQSERGGAVREETLGRPLAGMREARDEEGAVVRKQEVAAPADQPAEIDMKRDVADLHVYAESLEAEPEKQAVSMAWIDGDSLARRKPTPPAASGLAGRSSMAGAMGAGMGAPAATPVTGQQLAMTGMGMPREMDSITAPGGEVAQGLSGGGGYGAHGGMSGSARQSAGRVVLSEREVAGSDLALGRGASYRPGADEDRLSCLPRPTFPAGEGYAPITENAFLDVYEQPLSTFAIDVDTASYANVRRFLNQGTWPPRDAVRIEELINYFSYEYPAPEGPDPFSIHVEVATCPWEPRHRLVCIGLRGRDVPMDDRVPSNLVFLIDVSGSMSDPNKLELLKRAMRLLVARLSNLDTVSIVTYRDHAEAVLEPTSGARKAEIRAAIDRLHARGSTNGGAVLELAYDFAARHFVQGGTNRVILATDGDFNVGVTQNSDLVRLIERRARTGVFLSVLGFGTGNIKDDKLEALADKGNGFYAYIDGFKEAHRVLVERLGGTLVTIAKDVKIQVEFNPAKAAAYRLIGYENRALAARDFNDDAKDAGEIGAGHMVTALYEVVPAGGDIPRPAGVRPLKYQRSAARHEPALTDSNELMTIQLRYKEPAAHKSKLLEVTVVDNGEGLDQSSRDLRWAAAVATFGMVLRDSPYRGSANLDLALRTAMGADGYDPRDHRAEFISLIRLAKALR